MIRAATIIMMIVIALLVLYYRRQENIRRELAREERLAKDMTMIYLRFSDYTREENGYEKFLENENLPTVLLYFREHMDTRYPSIRYGTVYKVITIDRLRNEYMETYAEIDAIGDDLSREGISIDDFMNSVHMAIAMDGILVSDGVPKVERDSEEALIRNAKARCMNYLYVDRYVNAYAIWGYNDIHFEAFLEDERLPIFLTGMKEYMDTHYPEIGYGSQYEEVTVERLRNDYETAYVELEEIAEKLKEIGGSWRGMRIEIREEADMTEDRYKSRE